LNISCVSPGLIETSLFADVPEKIKMVTSMQAPLRRLAKPVDMANVVSFLSSDDSNYMTGETVRVCGGQLML
jgi:3-oxoacyl-[acyl-carrier protein] reductase